MLGWGSRDAQKVARSCTERVKAPVVRVGRMASLGGRSMEARAGSGRAGEEEGGGLRIGSGRGGYAGKGRRVVIGEGG